MDPVRPVGVCAFVAATNRNLFHSLSPCESKALGPIVLILLNLCAYSAIAQVPIRFEEVTQTAGIAPYTMTEGMGGGAAAADYDNDGDIDLFVPNGAGLPDQLYRNNGNGQFSEIGIVAGLGSTDNNRCALWFDYDGDGALDLLVANDIQGYASAYRLYRQMGGDSFQDVTQSAGLLLPVPPIGAEFQSNHRGGLSAGDLNGDGFLDVFAPMWNATPHLFLNNGNGTFADITATCGIDNSEATAHQPIMADFDEDGLLDIYQCIDFAPNRLWLNQGNAVFIEAAAPAGLDNNMNDMGVTINDYDNDQDPDIYVTNIVFPTIGGWNVLLKNQSTPPTLDFVDVAPQLNVDQGGWGWGTTFLDADMDGWVDIAATNGWSGIYASDESRFFWNQGGNPVSFLERSAETQFNDSYWGSALVALDYDRDGDLDLAQTCRFGPFRLLENVPAPGATPNNYLVVKPRQSGPNRRAIGSVVRITAAGMTQSRWITAGTSYLGQEPAEAHFGIGNATVIDTLEVIWPNGTVTHRTGLAGNQTIVIGCGDSVCDINESPCDCIADCGVPDALEDPVLSCTDGLDNDCDGLADADDPDCCNDGNVCTQDAGDATGCVFTERVFGDVNANGITDIFDILCVLDGFGGEFAPPCTPSNLDLSPCPGGDGDISIFDILAVLDAFAGTNVCGCIAGP